MSSNNHKQNFENSPAYKYTIVTSPPALPATNSSFCKRPHTQKNMLLSRDMSLSVQLTPPRCPSFFLYCHATTPTGLLCECRDHTTHLSTYGNLCCVFGIDDCGSRWIPLHYLGKSSNKSKRASSPMPNYVYLVSFSHQFSLKTMEYSYSSILFRSPKAHLIHGSGITLPP